MTEMEESKIANYDDFDLERNEEESSTEGLYSPFTFVFFTLIIVLFGLLMLYSASFDVAVKEGFSHYHHLLNQTIGLFAGVLIGIAANAVPIKILRRSYYLAVPVALIALILQLFPSFNDNGYLVINGMRLVSGPLLGAVAVISLISGTISSIAKLKEMNGFLYAIVFIFSCTIIVLSAMAGGMGYYILISAVVCIMLYSSGGKKSLVVLTSLFLAATGVFLVFISPSQAESLNMSILPLSNPEYYDHNLFVSQLAIKDGGILGAGIGKGLYKLGILADVDTIFIFSSVVEETGLLVAICLFFCFFIYAFIGIRTARRSYKKNSYNIAGASIGLAAFVFLQAVLSALYCSGLFPFGYLTFPFFSYAPADEAIYVVISMVLYRYIYLMGRPDGKKG